MDLVTVTDHDSIDAVEELRRYPDFFLSEEVTCTMPSGTEMHAGVYGIEERDHIELQKRRHDIESLLAYAGERRLFVTVNHLYSSLTGRRTDDDFIRFARDFHGVETVNGMMLACANRLAADFARRYGKPEIGGSDAHTLGAVARTWTEVPNAANIQEYLAGMRRGQTIASGASGDYWKLNAAVFGIGGSFLKSRPWLLPAGAIMALAPVIILGNYFREVGFAWHWGQRHASPGPVAAGAVISGEFGA
ncbi:MAG TPA: PHP-associated domain-containing protein [Bryobacteraceae bacterium]|jgi:hypothetical protein|nr:PHP-associated domain-containing protein [Bryobacteraceae bacterium]